MLARHRGRQGVGAVAFEGGAVDAEAEARTGVDGVGHERALQPSAGVVVAVRGGVRQLEFECAVRRVAEVLAHQKRSGLARRDELLLVVETLHEGGGRIVARIGRAYRLGFPARRVGFADEIVAPRGVRVLFVVPVFVLTQGPFARAGGVEHHAAAFDIFGVDFRKVVRVSVLTEHVGDAAAAVAVDPHLRRVIEPEGLQARVSYEIKPLGVDSGPHHGAVAGKERALGVGCRLESACRRHAECERHQRRKKC